MLDWLVSYTQNTLLPFGASGLGLLTFAESAFFPVPPEVLLIPLLVLDPANALYYAAIATVFSTLGSLLGWQIGDAGGKRLLKKFVSAVNITKAEDIFKRYGLWALVISGFTPIPYKVFTISAGAFGYKDIRRFLVASTLGRGTRFFAEAIIIQAFGSQIAALVGDYLTWFGLALVIVLLGGWLVVKRPPILSLRR